MALDVASRDPDPLAELLQHGDVTKRVVSTVRRDAMVLAEVHLLPGVAGRQPSSEHVQGVHAALHDGQQFARQAVQPQVTEQQLEVEAAIRDGERLYRHVTQSTQSVTRLTFSSLCGSTDVAVSTATFKQKPSIIHVFPQCYS